MIKKFIKAIIPYTDLIILPVVFLSGLVLLLYRKGGSSRLKINTWMLKKIGVFPIRDHFYEPFFNHKYLTKSLTEARFLPGLDFREKKQLKLLETLSYQREFDDFIDAQEKKTKDESFHFNNGNFESGDAEFLFNFLRHIKPQKVIEVGCGSSTKIISYALSLNRKETKLLCEHICVEPYEQKFLEKFNDIKVIRDKLEDVDMATFKCLRENDFLFIDSTHVIKPQGDVLKAYLEIIPSLSPEVYVHVHDIFSPRDYPTRWVKDDVRFWNEQYLVEGMLSKNDSYEIVAALNFLKNEHYNSLKRVCQYLTPEHEPASLYFKKRKI